MNNLVKSNRELFPAIPSLLDEFFSRDWFDSSLANWNDRLSSVPAVNIRETGDNFLIEVAAPGMHRDNFKVELNNDMLTISAQLEDQSEDKADDGAYARREFSYRSFERRFTLPENKIKSDEISARYTDGILYITVPKTEEARVKPPRQIAIA